MFMGYLKNVATLLLEEWEDDTHTPKMGTWEFVGTPKTSEVDFRGQNTLHWDVLYIIGKLSKRRCRKWACMSHLDIFSTSHDKKKVWNRHDLGVCRWSVTHYWKALDENCNFTIDLIPIGGLSKELWPCKGAGIQTGTVSRLIGDPGTKRPFGCGPRGELQSILYGGRWWLPPSPGRGESCESRVTRGLSWHQGCSRKWTNQLVVGWMQIRVNN